MSGGAAGREEEATGRQGKSAMDVVPRRKRSGDTSAAGVGDEVSVVDHKDKCWMLDWVGGIGERSGGLVLYVVIKDNIVPIGGVVKWSGEKSPSAMLELTMVLNARGERMAGVKRVALRWAKHAGYGKRLYDIFNPPGTEKLTLPYLRSVFAFFDRHVVAGHEPVVHASDRISEPKSVLLSSLEAAPLSKPIIIGARPPPSIRTTVAATRVPKSGQIGEKGPCRGQIVPSAPVKHRPTSTKEPVSLVRPPCYELAIPAGSHYFGDYDEKNSEEEWERDGEREECGEGGEEEEVESEHTISERGGPGELEGRLGVEYEDEGQEEETTGEGGYADVHRGSKRMQLLAPGHGHWETDPGRGEMHREVGVEPAHADAVRLAEKKRKMRQERRSAMDSKKTKQEGGAKQEEGKRKLKMLAVEEAVQRTREAEEAMKKKRQPRKKAAKGGVMEKTSFFPSDQPQSDEDVVGKTVTRPPGLQILPHGNSSGHLSKDFFLEFDENGNQRPKMQFISVKLDRILDIPDEKFRYNQRFLDQELIDDLYKTMVESGEAAIRERTTGAAGVNVCALYEKPVLLLIGLHDTMHIDASGTNVRARRVTPREFDLQIMRKYYRYPLNGQHNVAAGRKCSQECPDIAHELRLDCWTARPVYYPDRSMENYCTLSTFQNAKDKWNTPPHQITIIKNIRELLQAAGRPEAIGGTAANVKNKDYREFAAMALRATGSDHLVTLSLQAWRREWSDFLGPYMILARATDDVFDKVQQVYSAWESGQLSGKDGVKPATKQCESGKAPRLGPRFELEKGVRVQCTGFRVLEDLVTSWLCAIRMSDHGRLCPSSAEPVADISALVRRERKPKMLIDVVEKNFLPSKWKMAGMDPPEKVVYDGMEKEPNAMVETLEHFCPADEAVVFLEKGHAGLVWELLKSHRHCIVLEGEGMKFAFLIQFIDKMVKTRDYYANFTKPPPPHDEGRDLVYKVGQNVVNIWEFLFETKPQCRGKRTYVLRRKKVEKLLRGYHKAPSEKEVSFLDRLETMYFDQQIGAFTIAGYVTCFVDREDFDVDDSKEESVDGTLQAALAAERQRACSPGSQRMGVPGTSCGSKGASSMAVSIGQLMT
ncbi:hypothetical protein CBR_g4850 [Chara braunii]|uniref:Uncharacterized protein n=1 Tax=Chara braunii TaxID=69332 RepID=A0A388KJ78_CHABU|nr:hypothetical protein CBR_g4850 [Chara braunii]|eukprot:GBG70023.1 hypothetical protein CBR_g4850 [Chara braunii]